MSVKTEKDELFTTAKSVRNIFTGNSFPYTEAFEGLPDLEVTEWEETDGDD